MPIQDQGYQHWHGELRGHAWRWWTITRQGVRAQLKNRWVWVVLAMACFPALLLSGSLVLWELFEQKSSLLTPFLSMLQGLPDELREGPREFRTTFWTLAFHQFLEVQLFFAMLLILLVGPELISQDLRFNAIPLYLSRPVRRIDYFAGKLGVIAIFLGAVMIFPTILAYVLGMAFSLDLLIFKDTWRVLAASLSYGAIVVLSAGSLMLAISSLSRNSRYVGALWIGIWVLSGVASSVLQQSIRQDWCPLLSYTANLSRVQAALLDSDSAWKRVTSIFQANQDRSVKAPGSGGATEKRRRGGIRFGFGPPAPRPPRAPAAPDDLMGSRPDAFPWQWSAGVLAGLGVFSIWLLATRVRSLDRLR